MPFKLPLKRFHRTAAFSVRCARRVFIAMYQFSGPYLCQNGNTPKMTLAALINTDAPKRNGIANFWWSSISTPVRPTTRKVARVKGAHREAGGHLAKNRRLRHVDRRDAECLANLGQDREHAEVERVRVEEQAERHRDQPNITGRCAPEP